jgi:hypothetical protein
MKRFCTLLERRIATTRLLQAELRRGLESLVSLDLETLRDHTSNQENLCAQVQFLDQELQGARAVVRLPAGFDSADEQGRQLADLLRELQQVQAETMLLNRTYSGLLRRSRQTTNLKMNLIAQVAHTYLPPISWRPVAWQAASWY